MGHSLAEVRGYERIISEWNFALCHVLCEHIVQLRGHVVCWLGLKVCHLVSLKIQLACLILLHWSPLFALKIISRRTKLLARLPRQLTRYTSRQLLNQ